MVQVTTLLTRAGSETWVSNLELRPNGSLVWGEIFIFDQAKPSLILISFTA
jgi:hypothetical protein